MANPTIRMVAFYLNEKKAATVNQVDYQVNPARQAAFGAEGYLAHSKGAKRCQVTVNEVTPVAGSSFTELLAKILAQEDIDCAMRIGGKTHRCPMSVTAVSFKSASESGMTDGSMTLEGGEPQIT